MPRPAQPTPGDEEGEAEAHERSSKLKELVILRATAGPTFWSDCGYCGYGTRTISDVGELLCPYCTVGRMTCQREREESS